MPVTLTAGLVRTALSQIGDLSAALSARLTNIPDDEAVADDILTDIAMADPALAPAIALAEALAPVVIEAVAWAVANNRSALPGAQLNPAIFGGTNENPARGR
jgi:hypothetical protein